MKKFLSIFIVGALLSTGGCIGLDKINDLVNDTYKVVVTSQIVIDSVMLVVGEDIRDNIETLDSALGALKGALEMIAAVTGITLEPVVLASSDNPTVALSVATTNLVETVRQQGQQ